MQDAAFIHRLTTLKRSIRRRLIAYGLLAVLAGGVVATMTIIAVDWLLTLPAILRIVTTSFFFAGFFGAAYRWIVKPMRARLELPQVAAQLDAHFPDLRERLSSAVNFVSVRDAGSATMIRRMVEETDAAVNRLPLESILSVQPLLIRGVLLILGVIALTGVGFAAPAWLGTGVQRYLSPFGPAEWPRSVVIVPLTGDLTVAVGESAALGMRVDRGLTDGLRGLVHLREASGNVMTRALQREPDGIFRAVIDAVTENTEYWFEAGDDSTERRPHTIRVVRRPVVIEATATVEPPAYAFRKVPRVWDLNEGPVRTTVGGIVTVAIRSSKPIAASASEDRKEVGLVLETGGVVPLIANPQEPMSLSARFDVTGDSSFRVELVDVDGFTNHGALRYSIIAAPDAPPGITVLEPKADSEVTAAGSVDLSLRAEDDLGLTDVRLIAVRQADGGTYISSLSAGLLGLPESERVETVVRHRWSPASFSASPGDIFVLTAEAVDNYPGSDGGQISRSSPIRVRIISDVEFEVRLRDDLSRLEDRIRRATLDQAELLDQTSILVRPEESPGPLTSIEREAASVVSARQVRLVRRVEEIVRRLADLADQGRRNRPRDEAMYGQIAALGNVLNQIAGGPMSTAGKELNRAAQPPTEESDASARLALKDAVLEEETAVNRMRALIDIMSQWGNFQGLKTRTRDLLDRQNALQGQTAQIGQSTLGKSKEALSTDETSRLKRAQRQQEQLAADVEQHLARLGQLAVSPDAQDPADRESMEAALRAARAQDLTKHLRSASEAIGENRTSAASVEQRASAEAMRTMIEAFDRRERRELENLRKDLERTVEHLTELIREQESLRAQTQEAASESPVLQQEQRRLRNNTRLMAEELAENRRLAPAAKPIREAVAPMTQAEDRIRKQQRESAADAQTQAVGLLKDALVRLQEIDALAEEEQFLRSLAEIRNELETMLAEQTDINNNIAKLRAALTAGERLTRTQAREASKLAQLQQENRVRIDTLRPALSKVVVYSWALDRVAGWMDEIRTKLEDRRLEEELAVTGRRIARELQQLIHALADTQKLPKQQEFAESEQGGGEGEGGAGQARPVPPVAELLVLKAKQVDINERTRLIAASVDLDQATEDELREIAVLGEDQKEVRRLTEWVTRGPNPSKENSND